MPEIVRSAKELFALTSDMRARGAHVGLVPTMGALHDGHMSLVSAARAHGAGPVVVSIFVNPLQFGPGEDLSKYPRTFDDDVALCATHAVDVVYAPSAQTMYPEGFQTHVEVECVTRVLEGAARPTHFRGVTTIVTKLFNATGPCTAAFGRKDYQQWRAIERMVSDLDMPVRVLGCPILREADGLALSSRNRYLGSEERQRATAIHAGLCAASRAFAAGEHDPSTLRSLARERVAAGCDSIDYISVADAESLQELDGRPPTRSLPVMLIAARIGKTRLIDNAVLGADCLG